MPKIELTADEVQIIKRALQIASRDGSIYGDVGHTDTAAQRRNAEIETIQRKLSPEPR